MPNVSEKLEYFLAVGFLKAYEVINIHCIASLTRLPHIMIYKLLQVSEFNQVKRPEVLEPRL